MIAGQEEVEAEDAALALLAEAGDGSMRDALSIMDQAIASAPLENGRAVLSGAQIRELMGSVPNAVFERLLEAVAAGQSAELMEQLNLLVNAGHSPSSLARQMVRYLRNALMAKLGGEQTELLQISGDERSRATRTALLFTEEELTRNLQIVLRTFDDLNYRQEQRFHLELGLLKLIHAQRLLPLEELLSGAAAGAGTRTTPTAAPRPAAAPARSAPATAPSGPSTISPFGSTGSSWGATPASPALTPPTTRPTTKMESSPRPEATAAPVATLERPVAAPAIAAQSKPTPFSGSTPFPAAASPSAPYGSTATLTDGALAKAPEPSAQPLAAPSLEAVRHAIGSALVEAGHVSAAQLLGTGNWILESTSLRIEVPGMGKKMLALTINAAAEKIIRQELQRLGAPTRFLVVPGEGTASAHLSEAPPPAGSVHEAALANPLVQRAKEIFKAEVRSVVDLRQK
jgi:DNA polymerase-3 subunit gamma/tau